MNNKLILRTLISPFPTPYSDITKGSVLSHADVDGNFIYLKGETIYTATTSGNTVYLNKLNGNTVSFNVSGGSGNPTVVGLKKHIRPTDIINIATDYEYLIYGDLILEGGVINNNGDLVIINGNFINSGGTYNSSGGTITLVQLEIGLQNSDITGGTGNINKFVLTTGLTANTPLVITHGLGSQDIVISVRDLNTGNIIGVAEFGFTTNTVTLQSSINLSNIRITIIG